MNYLLSQSDNVANSPGISVMSREVARERTRALAVMAGRPSWQISKADYEQAKRELTGETDHDLQDALFDTIPELGRWDPVPGSAGTSHSGVVQVQAKTTKVAA